MTENATPRVPVRTNWKLDPLAEKMIGRYGDDATTVALSHARMCRHRGDEQRASLWLEVIRLIRELKTRTES